MKEALIVGRPVEQVEWTMPGLPADGLADDPVGRDGTLAQLNEWVHYLSDQLMVKEARIQQMQRELQRSWGYRWRQWWQGQRK